VPTLRRTSDHHRSPSILLLLWKTKHSLGKKEKVPFPPSPLSLLPDFSPKGNLLRVRQAKKDEKVTSNDLSCLFSLSLSLRQRKSRRRPFPRPINQKLPPLILHFSTSRHTQHKRKGTSDQNPQLI